MKYRSSILSVLALAIAAGCSYDPAGHDITLPEETLTLQESSAEIVLDEENLQDDVITFSWSPARDMGDDYVVTYTTKLDVVGNNFGSTTVIKNIEEDGVFSRSFTSEQINNWANERWNLPVNKQFILQFRVTVEFAGGPTFEAPEVRTTTVNVTPIHVDIFDADKISIGGTAIAEQTEIKKTLENDNIYAWYGELGIGELSIPVEFEGLDYFIKPSDGQTALHPAEAQDVVMDEEKAVWNIPAAGFYRIIVDMQNKQVTIYTPETDLQPFVATFRPNGAEANPETSIPVTELWAYGAGTGWGVRQLNVVASAADPQILTYTGSFNGGVKFCIAKSFTVDGTSYNQNNSYCFTNPLTAEGKRQNLTLTANKVSELHGGADGETRNSYYTMPSGTYIYIFDLRNMTILAKSAK
ncbi:MAG: SusE domain-containing protein [Bacteroidales bacterium]|nr:SusE domain-containing protein [Bacteroidales bacterium]